MTDYTDLLKNNEDWLMNRILAYAEKLEFTKYTSTLAEAWRLSISGLSNSLILAANHYSNIIPELHPDDKYINDPISRFGVIEAQKHRKRGTTLGMFLGLMKYYKESYIDLIEHSFEDNTKTQFYKNFTQRCFDRIEIAYCIEWTGHNDDSLLNELQDSNRKMTNEKNKYLTIFESSYAPVILLDETLKIANLNQTAIALFSNLEVAGSIYYNDSSSDLTFKKLNKQILQFLKSKPRETYFETHLTTNKGDLLFQVKLKKMQDVSKKFSGTVIMLDDITERKKAEEELSRQNKLFNTLLENLQIGVYMIEVPSGKPLVANEASFKLLGRGILPDEDFSNIAKLYALYKSESDTPYPNEELPLVLAMSGVSKHVDDIVVKKPDGTSTALEASGSPVLDDKGNIWASLVSFQDITERKQADLALKEREKEFRSLAESMPQIVWTTRADGWNTYFNQKWVDYTGLTLEESYGHGWNIPFHPEDKQRAWDAWQNAVNNNAEYSIDCRLRCHDGMYHWWLIRGVPQISAGGKIKKWFGTCTDIEKIKEAELALKESEKQLLHLNADKDRFISILGHDLKGPFNNILGFSKVLFEEVRNLKPEEIEVIADHINKSAIITNKLLEDILLWARAQQGSLSFQPRILSLAETCRDILEILNPSAYAKNITIYDASVEKIDVYADSDMIKTILLNLVSNAIKFTSSGGRINISAEQNSENVTISVSDNGNGIPPYNLPRLFNISEVLTTKGTAGETGTGLGLLLCKEFIEKHGGRIWVESEVGKGSNFKFTLQLSREQIQLCT